MIVAEQHPVTPSLGLLRLWAQQAQRLDPHDPVAWIENVATKASRWGADQELEACREWADQTGWDGAGDQLHAARRPKPVNLKRQALLAIDTAVADDRISADVANIVRRALEQRND